MAGPLSEQDIDSGSFVELRPVLSTGTLNRKHPFYQGLKGCSPDFRVTPTNHSRNARQPARSRASVVPGGGGGGVRWALGHAGFVWGRSAKLACLTMLPRASKRRTEKIKHENNTAACLRDSKPSHSGLLFLV